MLLRGEIIWQKADGATGSCAWGSYRSARNPVLRDVTERVIVASNGRFDRAVGVDERRTQGCSSRLLGFGGARLTRRSVSSLGQHARRGMS
ncbi:MAG: hypothetical protein M3063_04400 [Actinomycetota bacterium]|nr:hypothetical protein [Actinomycetota bacterium]